MTEPTSSLGPELVTIPKAELRAMVSDLATQLLTKCIKGRATILVDKIDDSVAEFMKNVPVAPGSLSINGVVEMALTTADANGWNDDDDTLITRASAEAQLTTLAPVALSLTAVIEAIRKPDHKHPDDATAELVAVVEAVALGGLMHGFSPLSAEAGCPLGPSKTKLIARLMLIISEAAEGIEAVLNSDWAEFGKENSDMLIRIGHMIGHYNRMAPMAGWTPINLEADTIDKDRYNQDRGYRHGGNKA